MDEVDRAIVALLRTNARLPTSEIARRVGLTSAPVARRIDRLERSGAIRGYIALLHESATVGEFEAFTQIHLTGSTATVEIEQIARQVPEVHQYFIMAGDTDALLRFRVRSLEDLQRVVNAIRQTGLVSATKTLIVMSKWDRETDTTDVQPPPLA